jgi:RNA polymerase sigma-70 factor (ECF subfamily)
VSTDDSPDLLLERARAGDVEALGRLLELYRNYLRVVARSLLGSTPQAYADPSDLIQETFLKAAREFRQFVGQGEPELVAWLRRTLVRTLSDHLRHRRAYRRDDRRQQSLEALMEQSASDIQETLAATHSSPSAAAARRERAVLLADALAKLPEDYQEVVLLRNLDHIPFETIAARMGRSPGAVRMIWPRAMVSLRRLLEDSV